MITVARRFRRRSTTFITPALSTTFGAPDPRTMPNPILGRLSSPALGECGRRRYPASKTTIEARSTRDGVGHFSYANGPHHHIFEIWRVGNLRETL
jgi:hypothetical protein